jgi:proline racemase
MTKFPSNFFSAKLGDMAILRTIDTHTEGEPTRIILYDTLKIKGNSMHEKRKFFIEHYDAVRSAIMLEPRGHKDMFGAVLTESPSGKGDFGIFFIDNNGCLPMCVHATIGATVALNKLDLLDDKIRKNGKIIFETPEGIVTSEFDKSDKNKVTVTNVPSYLVKENVGLKIKEGRIYGDVYYSGNYVYIIDPEQVEMDISLRNQGALVKLGMKIKDVLSRKKMFDKVKKKEFKVSLVEFSTKLSRNTYKNMAIFGEGQFDRSPCGTGSSAKLAQLFRKKVIGVGKGKDSFSDRHQFHCRNWRCQ